MRDLIQRWRLHMARRALRRARRRSQRAREAFVHEAKLFAGDDPVMAERFRQHLAAMDGVVGEASPEQEQTK